MQGVSAFFVETPIPYSSHTTTKHTVGPEAGEENSPGEGAAGQQLGGEHGHISGEGASVPWAGGRHVRPAQGPLHQADGVSSEPV